MTPQQHSHMVVRAQSEAAAKGKILRYTEEQSKFLESYYISSSSEVTVRELFAMPAGGHVKSEETTNAQKKLILEALDTPKGFGEIVKDTGLKMSTVYRIINRRDFEPLLHKDQTKPNRVLYSRA